MSLGDPFNQHEPNAVTYAEGRLPTRTYVSRSFPLTFGRDRGYPARYIHRVFDELATEDRDEWEWVKNVVYKTPGGRKQLELQVAREAGIVRKLRIQKVPTSGDMSRLETILELDREQASALLETLRAVHVIQIQGDATVHVDDRLLQDVFSDPSAISRVYAGNEDRVRALIESDVNATDVVALEHRRQVAATMRSWIDDSDTFAAANSAAGGPEKAWQGLLEANPWVLGIALGGQLLTEWAPGKLEQTVVGRSIKGVGKRPDALLRTKGIIESLVFAEIKHHHTPLIGQTFRSGTWNPSTELLAAVAQAQQTSHLASLELGDYIRDKGPDGELLSDGAFILRPRSFVVIGCLQEIIGESGGPLQDKFRSFELFRRNLHEPELLTFDELVARAEWHVEVSTRNSSDHQESNFC